MRQGENAKVKLLRNPKIRKFWLLAFTLVAAVIIFAKALDYLPAVARLLGKILAAAMPVIVAFIIAFILYIPQNRLEKLLKKAKPKVINSHARGFSVLITYLAFLLIIVLLLSFIIPWVFRNLVDFITNSEKYYNRFTAFIGRYLDKDGKLFGFDVMSAIESFSVKDLLSKIDFGQISRWAGGVFKAGSAVVDFFISAIISVYMLLAREHLCRVAGKILTLVFPKDKVLKFYHYITRIGDIFYSYIYSQLVDCAAVSLLMTVLLLILRIPYAPLFGILIGVSNLIPYFGAIISCAVVSIFVLITDSWGKALITLAFMIAAQQLDANILQPRIVGHTVGIRPIYVLIAVTIFGALFGPVGILIGVPVTATLRMIVLDLFKIKEERKNTPAATEPGEQNKEAEQI